MKRMISFAMGLLMVISLLAVPVLAETDNQNGPTTDPSQEPSQPASNIPSDFDLEFTIFQVDGNTLTVQWNREESGNATVTGFRVDNTDLTVSNGNTDTFTVNLSKLHPGVYTEIEVYLKAAGAAAGREEKFTKQQFLVRGGDINITIKDLDLDDVGHVTAVLVDQYGSPISGEYYDYTVTVWVKGDSSETCRPDENGRIVSKGITDDDTDEGKKDVLIKAENDSSVKAKVPGFENVVFNFVGANKSFFEQTVTTAPTTSNSTTSSSTTSTQPPTTTAPTEPEITVSPTSPSQSTGSSQETLPTYELVPGAGTTSMMDGNIAVNITVDTNILKTFGLKKEDFDGKGRLIIKSETYQALVGNSSGSVTLNLLSPHVAISDGLIQGAINGVSDFSTYSVSERRSVVFDLSLIMTVNGISAEIDPISGDYMLQIPVPASMKGAEKLALTIYNGATLETPVAVQEQDGTIRFKASPKGTYVLMGFMAEDAGKAGGVPTVVIILLIVGVLLLAGAIVLLYFFVIRKPKNDEEDEDEQYDELGNPLFQEEMGTNQHSSADTGMTEATDDQSGQYVRLDDVLEDERYQRPKMDPPPKKPGNYDIDL